MKSTLKSILTTSAIALSVASAAQADSTMSGFYLGGNLGYATGKMKFNTNTGAANNMSETANVNGPVLGFHTGYQHQISAFVFGIEGSVNFGNTKKTKDIGAMELNVKRDLAFGVAGRLGVTTNNWLFYTKLGWENANFNLNIKVNDTTLYSKNQRANGFVRGLGVEKAFKNGIMLGGEWTYTNYKKVSLTGGALNDTWKPKIHDFKIRLGYKF